MQTFVKQLFLVATLLGTVMSRGILHEDGFIEELVASQRAFTGAFIPHPLFCLEMPPIMPFARKFSAMASEIPFAL